MFFNLCYFNLRKFYMSKEITFESLKLSYEAKKFLDVVHGCKILLEKEPIFFDCEFLLASSLVESGQNLESIKVFEAILKKYKEFPSTIYYNLSSAYKNQHMFKDALFYANKIKTTCYFVDGIIPQFEALLAGGKKQNFDALEITF